MRKFVSRESFVAISERHDALIEPFGLDLEVNQAGLSRSLKLGSACQSRSLSATMLLLSGLHPASLLPFGESRSLSATMLLLRNLRSRNTNWVRTVAISERHDALIESSIGTNTLGAGIPGRDL